MKIVLASLITGAYDWSTSSFDVAVVSHVTSRYADPSSFRLASLWDVTFHKRKASHT